MLSRIFAAGTADTLPEQSNKRTVLINKYCFSISLITLPYALIFYLAGEPLLGLMVVPVVLGYVAVILLNFFNLYNVARAVMLLTGSAAVTAFSLACGRDCGISLYFFALMVFPFIAFDYNDVKKIVAGISLPLLLFIVVEVTSQVAAPWVDISKKMQLIIYCTMIFSSALSIVLVAFYNFMQMNSTIAQLKETNKSLEIIFDNAYDIIMTIEPGSIYTKINHAGSRGSVVNVRGKSIFEMVPLDQAKRYAELNDRAFATGKVVHATDCYSLPDGATVWHNLTLCPVLNETDGVSKLIGFSRDITEEKKLLQELTASKELAEAANQAKSAFLANMSHEIRTPMASVLGFVDILERENLPPAKKTATIEAVRRNGNYLMTLLSEILDLTRIEAGQIEIKVTEVSLQEEITSVVDLLRGRAEKKHLTLQVNCSAQSGKINTDPLRFRQILINVIGNAIKFTSSGEVKISICNEEKLLRVDVADTGMGIPLANRKEIFAPFSQGEADVPGQYGGTGLGLAISTRLAEALGGRLQLTESEPGKGSIFTLYINPNLVAQPGSKKEKAVTPPQALKNLRILTAEDNRDVQDLLCEILTYEGAEVVRASNGKTAVEKIMSEKIDIVLMDVQMPEMNGYLATEQLRREGCRIPIIALTAFASVESNRRCVNAGFTDVIYKPFDKTGLISLILRYSSAALTKV